MLLCILLAVQLAVLPGLQCSALLPDGGASREGVGAQVPMDRPGGSAMVTVQVGYSSPGAAPQVIGAEGRPPPREPAPDVEVRAVPAGSGSVEPLATARTDQSGTAMLALPPGAYWVYVPTPPPGTDPTAAPTRTRLPDGTIVSGWAEVALPPGASLTATIDLRFPIR
jgi:hypothetical protein